jgi:hypothetical protein
MDAYMFSVFMHITGEGEERRLFMGPLWDFDIVAGNAHVQQLGSGTEGLYIALFNYWFRNLMQRPEFFEAVATRWNEIRHVELAETFERVRATATRYQAEFEREFERHVNPVPFTRAELAAIPNFMGHVEYLLNWYEARAMWLDGLFNGEFPEYCPLWRLVEYYKNESQVGIEINGTAPTFNMPLIRLPYATKIELQDAANLFNLQTTSTSEYIEMRHVNTVITHRIGSSIFEINGSEFRASAMSVNIREYTYIPLRAIAEILGYEVDWQEEERMVSLSSLR